jgi:xanthine dehydrogenase accessory factor
MTEAWIEAAQAALSAHRPAALISILATEGSAPRGAGTRMVVTDETTAGTIGGGALENQAIQQGRAVLRHPQGAWRVQDYPLGPLLGQCCGGRVRLLVERLDDEAAGWIAAEGVVATQFAERRLTRRILDPKTPAPGISARGPAPQAGDEIVERLGQTLTPVFLFGAGHVGKAVAGAIANLPFRLAWFDSRPEEAATPGVTHIDRERLMDCVADAPPEAAVLIMTHDHGLDYELTTAALGSQARFVGLIGSGTKRARFLSRLAKDQVDTGRLTCPIGVAGILGKEPPVIAISVAAQLLQLRGAGE